MPAPVAGGEQGPGGAIPAGVPEPDPDPACEGEEYEITVRFDPKGVDDEVEIVIRHLESDGTESEIDLEGSSSDVDELIEQLLSEGACATVELEPIGEDAPVEEAPEVLTDVASVGDTLEPVLP